MSAHRNTGLKCLTGIAVSGLVLAIGWPETPAIARASDDVDDAAFYALINLPANEIQEGQWCVAYANVYGYQGPLEYQWSGSYFSGTGLAVGADMWGQYGDVRLRVIDKGITPWDTIFAPVVYPDVGDYDYNYDCGA